MVDVEVVSEVSIVTWGRESGDATLVPHDGAAITQTVCGNLIPCSTSTRYIG